MSRPEKDRYGRSLKRYRVVREICVPLSIIVKARSPRDAEIAAMKKFDAMVGFADCWAGDDDIRANWGELAAFEVDEEGNRMPIIQIKKEGGGVSNVQQTSEWQKASSI